MPNLALHLRTAVRMPLPKQFLRENRPPDPDAYFSGHICGRVIIYDLHWPHVSQADKIYYLSENPISNRLCILYSPTVGARTPKSRVYSLVPVNGITSGSGSIQRCRQGELDSNIVTNIPSVFIEEEMYQEIHFTHRDASPPLSS